MNLQSCRRIWTICSLIISLHATSVYAAGSAITIQSTQFAFQPGSSINIQGVLTDQSGNGISGVQVIAEDPIRRMSRILGNTDPTGHFILAYTGADTSYAGLGAYLITLYASDAKCALTISLGPTNNSYLLLPSMPYQLGSIGAFGNISSDTSTFSFKTDASTIPIADAQATAISDFEGATATALGSQVTQFVENGPNDIALLGSLSCVAAPGNPVCDVSLAYVIDSASKQIAVNAAKTVVSVSNLNSSDKAAANNILDGVALLLSVAEFDPQSGLQAGFDLTDLVTQYSNVSTTLLKDSKGNTIGVRQHATGADGKVRIFVAIQPNTTATGQTNLAAPTLIGPANASSLQPCTPSMSWSAVSGATSYRIMVSSASANLPTDPSTGTSSGCLINAISTSTTYTPPAGVLIPGNTYYWTVHARSATQYGTWAAPISFSTASTQTPGVQTLVASPVTATSALITGEILNSQGSTIIDNRFDWGTNIPLSNAVYSQSIATSGSTFSTTLTGLTPNTIYYFRAWARNGSPVDIGFGTGWNAGSILQFQTSPLVSPNAPSVTSALLVTCNQFQTFQYTILATNNPTNFTVTGLPTGLSMNGNVISGAVAAAGTFKIGLSVSNASGTDNETLTLTVLPNSGNPVTATPTISPAQGAYSNSVQVTLACSTPGASIRFTTDGSDPTSNYMTYGGPFTLSASALVKAKAVLNGYNDSLIISGSFTIVPNQSRIVALAGNLSFGNVLIGTSSPLTLSITNNGNSTLTVSGISLPNGFSGSFAGQVGPGQTQYVSVEFSPTEAVSYGGNITVNSDSTAGVNTIPVSGSGTTISGGAIALSGNLDFGGEQIGTSSQHTLTISNPGSGPMYVSSISYPGNVNHVFTGQWSGNIFPGQSQDVSITFAPTATGTYSGNLGVNSTAGSGNPLLPISGVGTTINYAISLAANPAGAGVASGGGNFPTGSSQTVTATANSGFSFVNWTEGGTVVSSSPGYTFAVSSNRNLVANFSGSPTTYSLITLHDFVGSAGITYPWRLLLGRDGNFYGTSFYRGANGDGSIYSISQTGSFAALHDFSALSSGTNSDGSGPGGGLITGTDGNLYGVAGHGGQYGCGLAFTMSSSGSFSAMYNFTGSGGDGRVPVGELVNGVDGKLYGVTEWGGRDDGGTVFQMAVSGSLVTLFSFNYANGQFGNGEYPVGGLVSGSDGNLYGVTSNGGQNFKGTVFQITTSGSLTNLHNFTATEGIPVGGLVQGSDGQFYGATSTGPNGTGMIFKISSSGAFTMIYPFSAQSGGKNADGGRPNSRMVLDNQGNLYGTTSSFGPNDAGTIFKVTPGGSLSVLYAFTAPVGSLTNIDGEEPSAGLVFGNDGNLYGTTALGGANGAGTVFVLYLNGAPTSVLTVTSNPPSGGTVSGGGVYSVGSTEQITATANNGWSFTGWNDGDTDTTRTVSVPITGVVYTANFVQVTARIDVSAVPVGGGGVVGAGTYPIGSSQEISAIPNNGWLFVGWSDGNNGTPRTVTVPQTGASYSALFTQQTATVSVAANPLVSGSISGGGTFNVGSSQQISVTANPGWIFTGWTDGVAQNTREVSVSASGVTYTANFNPTPYTQWKINNFGINSIGSDFASDTATPAGDGIPNLLKYALRISPMSMGTLALPAPGTVTLNNDEYLTLTYTQVTSATDIVYAVEVSEDLQKWNSGAGYTSVISSTPNQDGVTQTVVARDLAPLGSGSKQFIRLKISKP